MTKYLFSCVAVSAALLSATALAAPGEYWEISTKMEMPGMPFAMPATTTKVCIAKGSEGDPKKSTSDKDCQMTDIKMVGNKSTWKVRCNHNGEVMTGTGEQTTSANGYEGKSTFTGKSGGHDVNMTSSYSGKRIGGGCDSDEMANKYKKQAQEQQEAMCDTSKLDTISMISKASLLADEKTCPGKKQTLCDAVGKDAPRNAEVYQHLANTEKHNNGLVAKTCGLNMEATTKAICKTFNSKTYRILAAHCPAEAKAFREVQRRKDCEGRSYTAASRAEHIKRCMSGNDGDEGADESTVDDSSPAEKPSRLSGRSSNKSADKPADKPAENNPAADVLEGAKKLKGLFGF